MPEGDTVWRLCRRLHEVLAGRVLTRSEFRVPALATTNLKGVVVREVRSRGKHQLFRFDNQMTLHTHLRMDGTWRIFAAGRRSSGGPDYEIRAILATAEHGAVGYRLPVIELIPTENEGDAWSATSALTCWVRTGIWSRPCGGYRRNLIGRSGRRSLISEISPGSERSIAPRCSSSRESIRGRPSPK